MSQSSRPMAGRMEEERLKRKEERWEPQSPIDVVFSFLIYLSSFLWFIPQHPPLVFLRPSLDLSENFPETHPSRNRLRIISAVQAQ